MREDQNLPDNEDLADEAPVEERVVEEPVAEEALDYQTAEAELDPYDDIGEVEGEAEMRDMIGYIARVLVDDTDAVQVTSNWNDGRLNINLKVADADKGKVIGRRGRVVHAMQSLLRVAATKSNMRAGIDVE
jgi:predicted RNA-binding protein YlqC (UPF0109 family)